MIITISREFGSGGRELGKRLADELRIPCYDNEIIHYVASKDGFDEKFVSHISEKSIRPFYLSSIAHRMSPVINSNTQLKIDLAVSLRQIIESFAMEGSCVIIGRSSDIILEEYKPLNIFVYASKESKIERTISRMQPGEHYTRKDIERRMKEIDRGRAEQRRDFSYTKWGDKENYHLCINTTGVEIRTIIPPLADYVRSWFCKEENNDTFR